MAPRSDPFHQAVEFILSHEGGLSSDPRDPGGVTRYGISRRAYPELDVASLTRRQAVDIYRRDYWLALRCHELPRPVALALMDSAVQVGRRRAARWLQGSYNDLITGYPLEVDGVIGPITARAIYALSDPDRHLILAQALITRRLALYARLARREPHRRYLRGWVRRVVALSDLIRSPVRWLPL